jgi:lipooligosaccharide transport system ATP-binding protein
MLLIVARGLHKEISDFTAVNGIDFSVQKDESLGLLRPNTAGKYSNTCIIGVTSERTSGEVLALSQDPELDSPQIRTYFEVVPQ